MTSSLLPSGLLTALVTPLQNDAIDTAGLQALIDYQIAEGASGVVVSGGTGEHAALSLTERGELIEAAVRISAGRIPVIAATGCFSTRDTMKLSDKAEQAGVQGLLLASPFAEPISWRERLAFYVEVDRNVSLPIMVYNTPPAGLLSFDQIVELSSLKNVAAVKDSSGDPELLGDVICWATTHDFGVYLGKDSLLFEALAAGIDGAVFGAANFMPRALSDFVRLMRENAGAAEVAAEWSRIRPILRFMEGGSNYVGLCKAGCRLRGLEVGEVRAPYIMPSQQEVADLKELLRQLS